MCRLVCLALLVWRLGIRARGQLCSLVTLLARTTRLCTMPLRTMQRRTRIRPVQRVCVLRTPPLPTMPPATPPPHQTMQLLRPLRVHPCSRPTQWPMAMHPTTTPCHPTSTHTPRTARVPPHTLLLLAQCPRLPPSARCGTEQNTAFCHNMCVVTCVR